MHEVDPGIELKEKHQSKNEGDRHSSQRGPYLFLTPDQGVADPVEPETHTSQQQGRNQKKAQILQLHGNREQEAFRRQAENRQRTHGAHPEDRSQCHLGSASPQAARHSTR